MRYGSSGDWIFYFFFALYLYALFGGEIRAAEVIVLGAIIIAFFDFKD